MKQAPGPRRKARGSGKEQAQRERTWYAALHETNLALSLAAGFIGPRFEKAGAVDAHAIAGRAVMAESPDGADLLGARGDLEYGSVVVAEIDAGKLVPSNAPLAAAPVHVPVSAVRRVLFPSQSALEDFQARLSGFSDVPAGLVPMVVSGEPFPEAASNALPEKRAPDEAGAARAKVLDALAGAIAGLLGAVRRLSWLAGVELLRAIVADTAAVRDGAGFVTSLAAALDEAKREEKSSDALLTGAVKAIDISRSSEGFDAAAFIAAVREQCGRASGSNAGKLEKLFNAAGEIAALRRDLSPNAFEDGEGVVVQRAFLMFLLNPDVDRIFAVPGRIKKLGPKVFTLACALAGYRAGICRTPREIKAPTNDAFVGTIDFAWHLLAGSGVAAEVTSSWSRHGKRRSELSLQGRTVLALEAEPDDALSQLLAAINEAGYKADISPTSGQISFRVVANGGEGHDILVSRDEVPAFPAQDCFRLSTVGRAVKSAREAIEAVVSANSAGHTKTFARQVISGKQRRIEWRVYCTLPVTAASVSQAALAIAAATTAEVAASPKAPIQPDLLGGTA